jgi:hypothetical protein
MARRLKDVETAPEHEAARLFDREA